MTFRERIARWAASDRAMLELEQPDDTAITVVSRLDAVDLYLADVKEVHGASLSPASARRLGWWLLRWWFVVAFCGLRTRLLARLVGARDAHKA